MKGTWDSARDPLAALRRGDPALFEDFVRTEAATLVGFFRRLGAGRAEAEDLAQEVFLKLFRQAPTYDPRGAFEAFAMRIARNAWIDRRRRRAARPRTETALELEPAGPAADPGAGATAREEAERLRRALAQLSESHALAFELGVVQGRPYAEIAAELGIPVGTVKSRVHHAVRRLRAALEEERA